MKRRVVAVVAAVVLLGPAALAADALTSGRVGPTYGLTGNGRRLAPAGRVTALGDFPTGGALTPDGRFYWAVDSGHGQDDVRIMDVATGEVRQVLALPGAYGGIAVSPDGRRVYVSGEPTGNSTPAGPVKGTQGDVIHVFTVDPASGHAVETTPIPLPATRGGMAQQENGNPASFIVQPPGPGPSSGLGWPIGLAETADSKLLVVALNQADQVAIINLAHRSAQLVKVGHYPYGVAVDGHMAYVTNEYDGTLSVLNLDRAKATTTIAVASNNSHPEGVAIDRTHHRLYAAVTNRDEVAIVDTRANALLGTVSVGRPEGIGTAPVAVAVSPDGARVFAADAGEDAVAMIDPATKAVVGRIPTAAYTSDVAITPDGGTLVWLAAKGLGAGPNPLYGSHFAASEQAKYGQYVVDMLLGRAGVLPTPTDAQAAAMTSMVNHEIRPEDLAPGPANTPLESPGGGPSHDITHVFYIVKENRTYDQLFGTDPRGDGDPKLELFDTNGVPGPAGGVTPNAHRLATMFPLLDHFFADSEVSVDGHLITSGSYATDFVQKALHASYANRGRTLNAGQDPITFPPHDFIFDQALRQGISFVNDGELNAGVLPSGADGRPTYVDAALHTAWGYPLFFGCDNAGLIPVTSFDRSVACDTDSGVLGAAGTAVVTSRFDFFQAQLLAEIATDSVPALTYITLPNDHTNGVSNGRPTPKAMVADNDLGLGQMVDLISHSSIWAHSAIFVVEDDSQDGADHVDAHRMPAYVISPWAKHGAVVHTRYDQESALRSVELILGMHPLSLFDGLAEPMYDAFISGDAKPDLATYTAVVPQQSLSAVTTNASGLDAALPYQDRDLVPQRLFDAALWRSVYGPDAVPPPPGPDASPAEAARADGALKVWSEHGDVTAWLLNHPVGDT